MLGKSIEAVNLSYGLRLGDLGSRRAIRRDRLLAPGMGHPSSGWPVEMVVKAARRKDAWRIA